MAKLIEIEHVERDYGMAGVNAVVESSDGKRLLICDGFGGVDSLQGGSVRWQHGMVVELQPTDSIESLRTGEWNDMTTHWDAMIHGYDKDRPILVGINPEGLAVSAGIA